MLPLSFVFTGEILLSTLLNKSSANYFCMLQLELFFIIHFKVQQHNVQFVVKNKIYEALSRWVKMIIKKQWKQQKEHQQQQTKKQ